MGIIFPHIINLHHLLFVVLLLDGFIQSSPHQDLNNLLQDGQLVNVVAGFWMIESQTLTI